MIVDGRPIDENSRKNLRWALRDLRRVMRLSGLRPLYKREKGTVGKLKEAFQSAEFPFSERTPTLIAGPLNKALDYDDVPLVFESSDVSISERSLWIRDVGMVELSHSIESPLILAGVTVNFNFMPPPELDVVLIIGRQQDLEREAVLSTLYE